MDTEAKYLNGICSLILFSEQISCITLILFRQIWFDLTRFFFLKLIEKRFFLVKKLKIQVIILVLQFHTFSEDSANAQFVRIKLS